MAVSYNKLWKLLVDKKMSKSDLRKKAEIAPNTMTKLRRDEEVSLTILSKICKTLNADFGDIVEYVPDAEIWDLYDENRELLGKDHVRGEQLPIDGYHLVVHVWIRNSKGEYLISQRSANRPTFPLMWECVGGSVVKGEDRLFIFSTSEALPCQSKSKSSKKRRTFLLVIILCRERCSPQESDSLSKEIYLSYIGFRIFAEREMKSLVVYPVSYAHCNAFS